MSRRATKNGYLVCFSKPRSRLSSFSARRQKVMLFWQSSLSGHPTKLRDHIIQCSRRKRSTSRKGFMASSTQRTRFHSNATSSHDLETMVHTQKSRGSLRDFLFSQLLLNLSYRSEQGVLVSDVSGETWRGRSRSNIAYAGGPRAELFPDTHRRP